MAAKQQPEPGVEYEIRYNSPNGGRLELRALDDDAVQQCISDIHANEKQRQALAASVGLSIPDLDLGIDVTKVTTVREQVAPR